MRSLLAALVLLVIVAGVRPAVGEELRGYGHFSRETASENGVTVEVLRFDDAEHAQRFASKLFSDLELTSGNRLEVWPLAKGEADVIALGDTGYLLPLLSAGSERLVVLTGVDRQALIAEAKRQAIQVVLRRSQLSHPPFMDKWDRYCLGIWGRIGDPEKVYPQYKDEPLKTHDAYYKWAGEKGINPQLNIGKKAIDLIACDNQTTWQRRYLTAYGVHYQRIEWLTQLADLYNRNPFLTHTLNPHVATAWSYYGERTMAGGLLRQVQNANSLATLKPTLADANQMAILDPDGEIGPHDCDRVGLYGPVARREFCRFLREVRGLSLKEVSQRYYGRSDALHTWEDVTMADWREFYGWTEGAVDLAGEWRFMRDDHLEGFQQGWAQPSFNDDGWIRLYYPGEAMVFALPQEGKSIWMRQTFRPAKPEGKLYLSMAPLTRSSVQVFINGRPVAPLEPHFHTAHTYGQFDITELARNGQPITVVLRLTDAPAGPIFLTPKPIESFPTSDPQLNARRWDHLEFVDWELAQAVGETLATIRSVEPDRPIKVHAYGSSPWGWKTVARYGGYSHHTGSGAGWIFTEPKRYGASRGLQHSSEPGGPMRSLRDFKGIWGALAAMGMSAHDYFISPQSITDDPEKRAFLESKLAAIKVMGRESVLISPVAAIRGKLNTSYEGEFARWEDWRYGVNPVRGGELVPLLDEVRIREGNLGKFRAIIDEGTPCWDDDMAASLRAYVEQGGVLFLNRLSGAHSFIKRDAGPGSALAGVHLAAAPEKGGLVIIDHPDVHLPGLEGQLKSWERSGLESGSLEALPGTDILGRWEDGTAALTRRDLGRGSVYFFAGTTYPKGFDQLVAEAFGPETYATADGGVDLLRTAQANNGSEDLLMLRGLGKPVTVTWNLAQPPAGGIYDAASGEPIEAKIVGRTVTFTLTIPDWDFRWFAVRRPDPTAVFPHWLSRQEQIWSGVVKDANEPTAPLFRNLDLNHGWKLVQADSLEQAKALQTLDDDAAGLKPTELIFWNAPGMTTRSDDQVVGLYRREFDLPREWLQGNRFDLVISGYIHDSLLHGFSGPGSIMLNGREIWSGERLSSVWLDVSALLKPEGNRLEILHPSPGIMPVIRLVRTALPESIIDLAGEWQAVTGLHDEATVTLPGRVAAGFVYRDVVVPESAADHEVWLRVEGRCAGAVINGRLRYRDMNLPRDIGQSPAYEIDITPDIRFGQVNRILLGNGWQKGELDYTRVELALYRPGQWSPDGKGTREALSKAELASVVLDAAVIQQYPIVHENAASAVETPQADASAPELPAVIVDLDLNADSALVRDRGPHAVEVTVKGSVEPFSEAGGQIRGVYLRGESKDPGTIELEKSVFRQQMEGKSSTIRVWLKPMAVDRSGGSLFNWSSYRFDWQVADDRTEIQLQSAQKKTLTVNALIRQRAWQCLTLVIDGTTATLYWDGTPVGTQTWDRPLRGTDVPLTIGSISNSRNFLNAKLAAFTVYEGALSETTVQALYAAERSHYQVKPAHYPEDDLFRLSLGNGAITDAAEIPGEIEAGKGVSLVDEKQSLYLSLDGQTSYLILKDHPRVGLLHRPFTLVLDFKPAPGTSGMILRRHHALCLQLLKDGTLRFDANIGRRNWLDFPRAITFGEWNRLRFSYDGKTARTEINGKLIAEEAYPGSLAAGSTYPLVIFADNTRGEFPASYNIQGDIRELRLMPLN